MIAITKDENGWYFYRHKKPDRVQYYKNLADVMPHAYAEEYKSRPDERSLQRDPEGDYQRPG